VAGFAAGAPLAVAVAVMVRVVVDVETEAEGQVVGVRRAEGQTVGVGFEADETEAEDEHAQNPFANMNGAELVMVPVTSMAWIMYEPPIFRSVVVGVKGMLKAPVNCSLQTIEVSILARRKLWGVILRIVKTGLP
jgi:hypothetical protein